MTLAHATAATLAETARERETLRLTAALGPADHGGGTDTLRARSIILGLSCRVRVRTSGTSVRVREPDARVLVEH